MGGGPIVADDFVADPSDMDLSEFLMVSQPSSEDGSVSEVTSCDLSLQQKPPRQVTYDSQTNNPELPMVPESSPENVSVLEVACDLGLQQKAARLVADDSTTDPPELPMVTESSPPENASVLEVTCGLSLPQKPARTLVLLGRSGNGKSATGNSILGRKAFKSKGRASGVTTVCELQTSTLPNGQILNVIDTPGLFSLSPSTEFTCRELLRCLSLSKEGIDAVLVVFSLRNRLTEEEKSALFALKILFGSKIVDYMIVVFTNKDALEDDGDTLEDYLNASSDFKDILMACNGRKVLFGNRATAPESQKAKQIQELLNYVEEIEKENGNPYMSDLSHEIRENETAFQETQRQILEMKGGFLTKQEKSQMMKDMAKSHENQQLSEMMEKLETKLRETTKRLEQQLIEEQAARFELEKRANQVEKHSSDVAKKLNEEQASRFELEKRASEVEKHSSDVVKKLNEEKAARLELEKRANEVEKHSSDVIKKLREDLKRAENMAKELQEKAKQCIIL